MADFDTTAPDFDRYRTLPAGVPAMIRKAVRALLGDAPGARLLDLGAGTGRIGEVFVAAGDAYTAVDPSAGMLGRFAAKMAGRGGPAPRMVQADGRALPFPAAAFDAVLAVQVVSGTAGWRRLLDEARRVLRPGGLLMLGKAVRPAEGVDARMREELARILDQLGVDARRPGAGRAEARDWLGPAASRSSEVVAARWEEVRSPRDYLARHATGARFVALPQPVRDEALRRLAGWAVDTFGALDARLLEPAEFVLDVFTFEPG
jgi:ubiquinone/menaquinone biosynthesis C-methylase UbiE